jgi:GT2 family glycosyltransferase
MTVDLLVLGAPPTSLAWALGATISTGRTLGEVHAAMQAWRDHSHRGDALLCWDPRLGSPDASLVARLVEGRGDVWHAGLLLGLRGKPELIDFVAPNWMLTADPPSEIECTSWRVSLDACLVRACVLEQMGLPDPAFETLEGAVLEWGHRCISRGVLLRHVPQLLATESAPPVALPLTDEVRFIKYRYGGHWTRWVVARAAMTEHAPLLELVYAMRAIPSRAYPEPAPYDAKRYLSAIDVTTARVTVLIPTLDRYKYLHVVLDQLRAQTIPPLEIIIVDQTASSKRDQSLAKKFEDLPLRLMYQDEPGQCASRNAGLEAARGDYILFIDDDDEVPSTLIEDHLRNLARFDADISSGVATEVGTAPLAAHEAFVRASNVFPTNNTVARREVFERTGLFDLAFNRAPRADGDLGMRVYLSGAFMVLDQSIAVLHHHASAGGLRAHKARVVTYRMSREMLTKRHLPHISEIYLTSRYFTPRQVREMLWLRTFGTLSGRGTRMQRVLKAVVGGVLLPDTITQTVRRRGVAKTWLESFPQIPSLKNHD